MITTSEPPPKTKVGEILALAIHHHQIGQLAKAQSIYQQILGIDPENVDALHLIGLIAHQTGDQRKALEWIGHAIRLNPTIPAFHNHCGEAWRALGDMDQAIACYRKAIELKADHFQTHNNLGNALLDRNYFDDAIKSFRKAIQLNPEFSDGYINLGTALHQKGQLTEAVVCYQRAIELSPQSPEAHHYLAITLNFLGNIEQSLEANRKAIQLSPYYARAHSHLLLGLHYRSQYSPQEIRAEHEKWNSIHIPRTLPFPHSNSPEPERKLKIGYVSADFRKHVVSNFALPILNHHDHQHFDVTCYFNHHQPDSTTRLIQEKTDTWRCIFGMKDEVAAQLIRKDQIDILIDLAGHTPQNRLKLFGLKPAPIQATYLGYPNTTGLASMDYRLTDALADPVGNSEAFTTEKLLRLPKSAWCYEPPANWALSDLPSLTTGHVTFGVFNALNKITPEMVSVWVKILKSLPNSRLVFKARYLNQTPIQAGLKRLFVEQNIDLRRLDFLSWESSCSINVNPYHLVDIGLDTFPYHGTTTTCEMLWMGVPVVTLAGETHVSRVGVSLLSHAGLNELIALNTDEYIKKAVSLAQNREQLINLRTSLRKQMKDSVLTNGESFTRDLELIYRQIWKKWCSDHT